MNTKYKNIHTRQSGFTLIELLVVIAIIGILSSVILAALNSARAKARDARRMRDINEINNAISLYVSANNHAPDFGDTTCSNPGGSGGDPTICNVIDNDLLGRKYSWKDLEKELKPYMKNLPVDPCGLSCFTTKADQNGDVRRFFFSYIYTAPGGWSGTAGHTPMDYLLEAEAFETSNQYPSGYSVGISF